MALPRKTRRSITVAGTRLRFAIGPGDEEGVSIVVQAADGHGRKLVAWTEHGNTLTPGVVARVVELALADGWEPRGRGPEWVCRAVPERFAGPREITALSRTP